MEQTNTPHTPDQQAGSAIPGPTQPQRPDDPAATESADTTAPPTEPDTGFEPV